MALFEWDEQTECGDESSNECEALDTITSSKAIRVTDPSSNCEKDLISPQYPAVPVLIGDELTEPRSGSEAHPIPIDRVQEYTGNTVPVLAFRNTAGQLAVWNPPTTCDGKKVIVQDGDFKLIDDVNINIFDESCIGSIADVDYIAGGRLFDDCNGVQRMQMVFFPKDSMCEYCS